MAIKKRASPSVNYDGADDFSVPEYEALLDSNSYHHKSMEDLDQSSNHHLQSPSLAAPSNCSVVDDASSNFTISFRRFRNREVTGGKKQNESSIASALMIGFISLGLLVICASWSSIHSSNEEVSQLLSIKDQSNKQVKSFEKNIRLLLQDISTIDDQGEEQRMGEGSTTQRHLEDNGNNGNGEENKHINNLQGKVDALKSKSHLLKEHVQEMSKREAIQKYGSGIHRVKIELAFPDAGIVDDGPDYFIIELAPMELMPHSVHFFLEMVSTGLLDGCSFILNALNVLKVAPLPYDGSSAAEKARAFTKEGLESVAFKEYSNEYPHKIYTVGFAADGSPSFYINTEDNSEIHLGDPCFGKIVEGLDAVDRLEKSPTRNGIWFDRRIGIKHATLLKEGQ